MRADFRAFLDDDDAHVGRKLLEPDRGGEAGRAGAHDHDVEFHRFAGRKLGHGDLLCGAAAGAIFHV